ncbi:hydroxyacid-oxoacid transhydrogenase [Halobellus limi]|uniref:hydroxyacid-oxoacid transhydrogenase n=1 Tax=Halobellus limi TaxID=699433 RepID=A0A1H6BQW3_9EURY|nr:hydroxyacid-oxoacid transhydrogenase [Halobellus limi]QCC49384.1 iron-containing alcohol dehydrogenase [Halobellus limi]SEG62845.1 Alcohol dehydrogenase, class IV [Halobellus limi]
MVYRPESVWEFSTSKNITFGVGASAELSDVVAEYDAGSVLVVTDEGVADAGVLDDAVASLDDDSYTVFDGVEPDPSIGVFEDALAAAADVDPDLVVGVGGGSSMDVAKTTSVVHAHGGDVLDYVAEPTGGGDSIPGPGVPTACLPTTAGTGSETSPVTVISLPDEDLKAGISSRHQRPDIALVDPGLTVSLPPGPTASSGMDALSHAIEAYVTRRYDAKPAPDRRMDRPDYNGRSMVTDQFARTAIEQIGNGLRNAVDNGHDLDARRQMSLGSLMAGVAFTNAGLGATHAIAMATGAVQHTPHGVTVALTLPEVMRFNATSAADRYAEIASLLGEDVAGKGRNEAAEAAATAVENLAADVGIEGGLSSLGIGDNDVAHLAERASQLERLLVGNPRRVTRDDLEAIIRRSL